MGEIGPNNDGIKNDHYDEATGTKKRRGGYQSGWILIREFLYEIICTLQLNTFGVHLNNDGNRDI